MPKQLQNFLRKEGVEALSEQYSILVKQHTEHPNLHLFKYDQLNSPMNNRLVQLCRGIILDQDDDWKVISFPYTKFWNHGEGFAVDVDWKLHPRVFEKLDGSLMTLYWYKNNWHVASSGTPDAGGPVNTGMTTFKELFWGVWKKLGYSLPKDTNKCYMFELMTAHNRVVVRHPKSRIVLHGVRNVAHGHFWKSYWESFPDFYAEDNGWECVKSYPLDNIESILESVEQVDPMDQEGYIVVDAHFNRVKIKSPQYVALHHMTDGMSPRRMLTIITTNEGSEFLQYFPEWAELYNRVKKIYWDRIFEIEDVYSRYKGIKGQKAFAMGVKDMSIAGALFNLRSGKVESAKEFLDQMPVRKLEQWLGVKGMMIEAEDE